MTTADAPRASARKTSAPVRTPLSSSTGTRPPTWAATSGSMSRLAGAGSTWRPPWLETRTADAPAPMAASAASAVRIPLAIHGRPWRAVASASLSQVQGGATRAAKVDATFGEPSRVTLPLQITGSRPRRADRFRARNPTTGQSTVTHSAPYPAALTRAATEWNES